MCTSSVYNSIVYNSLARLHVYAPLAAAAGARSPRGPLPRGRCRGGPLAAGAACRGLSGAVVEAAAAAAARRVGRSVGQLARSVGRCDGDGGGATVAAAA